MHLVLGMVAGTLIGAVIGAALFIWHVEKADGNLHPF